MPGGASTGDSRVSGGCVGCYGCGGDGCGGDCGCGGDGVGLGGGVSDAWLLLRIRFFARVLQGGKVYWPAQNLCHIHLRAIVRNWPHQQVSLFEYDKVSAIVEVSLPLTAHFDIPQMVFLKLNHQLL